MARDTEDMDENRHRRRRRARANEDLLAPLPGNLPPRAPWRRGKDSSDESWTPLPPRASTARPVGATPVPGLVPGGFVRPLPQRAAGTGSGSVPGNVAGNGLGNVLTLVAPPSLDPLGRLDCPSPFETDELLDPLADARRRGAAVVAGVVTGAITLPPLLGMNPAAAAIDPKPNPTPAVTLPTGIEDFAPYIGQKSCDPVAKPGVVAFSRLVLSYWGHGGSYGITRACNIGAQSEHKEGRAWDFKLNPNDYGDQVTGQRVIDWLLANDAVNARRLGIMYIIWNERIWSAHQHEDGWHPYHGPDNHTSHIHFSFSWAGAMKRTSWWTGVVAPIEYGPCQKYLGSPIPVYGTTINLSPCPKPKPKPKPADNKNDGKHETKKPTKITPGPKPKPKPAPEPATHATYKVIKVHAGQTLGGIAQHHHTSVHRLVKLNHLRHPDRLSIGQKLRVPAAGGTTAGARSVTTKSVPAKQEHAVRLVTVKSGDTLGDLALRFDSTVPAIVKANHLESADHIYPGQRLRIP